MKYTQYFLYTRNRPDRQRIKEEWIRLVVEKPDSEKVQLDGRIQRWGWIKEENKYLRVILLEDRETVHNAFFDRDYKKG
jgi:hypothetical protein